MATSEAYFRDNSVLVAPQEYRERYLITKRVINDSQVYYCYDTKEEKEVVLKAEKIGRRQTQLYKEYQIYQKLKSCHGFDSFKEYFVGYNHRFMIFEKHGIDLSRHYRRQRSYGLWKDSDLNGYAIQMIEWLQKCHSYGIVHLDPKPNNYVLDSNDPTKVYLIDFDCGKELFDSDGQHIPLRTGLSKNEIKGNRAYVSIHSHDLVEQSRRDDMIFLGYSFIWMARNGLPWNKRQSTDFGSRDDYYQYIRAEKVKYTFEELCRSPEGKPFPQLITYMEYCNGLEFAEEPDYRYLMALFADYL